MKRMSWAVIAVAVACAIVFSWKLLLPRWRESRQEQVRRLLHEMAYQPSDLDFYWSGRSYSAADAEMKRLGRDAVPHLITCLQDEDWLVRRQAVDRLRMLADPRAVPALIACVEDPDSAVCVALIDALLELAPDQAVEPVLRMLRHPKWHPRREAVRALEKIGDRRAIGPLRQVCADLEESADTRRAAEALLRRLEGETPAPEAPHRSP
jgi:HEAT repeat protein